VVQKSAESFTPREGTVTSVVGGGLDRCRKAHVWKLGVTREGLYK